MTRTVMDPAAHDEGHGPGPHILRPVVDRHRAAGLCRSGAREGPLSGKRILYSATWAKSSVAKERRAAFERRAGQLRSSAAKLVESKGRARHGPIWKVLKHNDVRPASRDVFRRDEQSPVGLRCVRQIDHWRRNGPASTTSAAMFQRRPRPHGPALVRDPPTTWWSQTLLTHRLADRQDLFEPIQDRNGIEVGELRRKLVT